MIAVTYGGTVYEIDPVSHGIVRKYETKGPIRAAPAVGSDVTVYAGTVGPSNTLYSFAHDGGLRWTWTAKSPLATAPVLDADSGLVIFASLNGLVAALEQATGIVKWCLIGRMGK